MPRFLIEVPHESDRVACTRAVRAFLSSGSHFLTHADWGCKDDDHRAFMVVELASREEARAIVPPDLRAAARVVRLNRFNLDEATRAIRATEG